MDGDEAPEAAATVKEAPKRLADALGFSFSPCGLLFPYYIGVWKALCETGLIAPDTPVSGSSGGCLLAVFNACEIDPDDVMRVNREIQERLLAKPQDKILGEVVKGAMQGLLPDNVHTTVSKRVGIAITRLWPIPWGILVEDFVSKEDVVDVMVASTYMPAMSGPNWGCRTRHGLAADGLLSKFFPSVPKACRSHVKITIKVSAAPKEARPWFTGKADISPDLRSREHRYPKKKYYYLAMNPFNLDIIDDLMSDGYKDAMVWVQRFLHAHRQQN
ncbi:unnamed protein product [Ostreobium quekettii]|uniref:Patatin n=1 Tax=Ostreobium quekettii TaxID=121088 RepID=A0A8S1ITJ1_9CHLO|nr:unnamed protein product [Ostreobium quekettii]